MPGVDGPGETLLIIRCYPGQLTVEELERMAAAGERPRKDYVEVARALRAKVVDRWHMEHRASLLARALFGGGGLTAGPIVEAFARRNDYRHVCVWSDRIGLLVALVYKLTRSRRDLVLISSWLSLGLKAFLLRRAGVHSHLSGIISYSSAQLGIARSELGLPREKLHHELQSVDDRFWRSDGPGSGNLICSVGFEHRDYPTLFKAVRGLEVEVQLAIGSGDRPAIGLERRLLAEGPPSNVRLGHFRPLNLRRLYASCRFVVVPLLDADFDAGVSTLTEAMAMGRAVVVTRTRGQVDLIRDGEEGIYVPAGDVAALRTAIEHLLAHPEEAERMGRSGRALIERNHTLDGYVERVAAIVRAARG
jgi:glycosyltransferase involved in cell wall biosynthesis